MNNKILIRKLIEKINESPIDKFNVMEVCGTHTGAISRFGIRQLVSSKITFLSGPGCPVCVTPENYIDTAIRLLEFPNIILTTFGDMLKVRGNKENLLIQKEMGKDIRILCSPLNVIGLAQKNKDKEIVFLGVGFETTAPLVALAIKLCKEKDIKNVSFLIGMKRMKPILKHILKDSSHNIQGLICPGHVAAVTGADYFKFITDSYNIPAIITGFGELDIIGALYYLIKEQNKEEKNFRNLYKSCVTNVGNKKAEELIKEMFICVDDEWRGIGVIRNSGFFLKEEYYNYDATKKFKINLSKNVKENNINKCNCSDIILGKKLPSSCRLFSKSCTPEHPMGPCMISDEGACSIFYKYRGVN